MISKQKQIGVLRSLIIKQARKRKIREVMLRKVRGAGHYGKGSLQNVISNIRYISALSVKKTQFDKETGVMTYAEVRFPIDLAYAKYGQFLDAEAHDDEIRGTFKGEPTDKITALKVWIRNKPKGTWRTPLSIDTRKGYQVSRLAYLINRKMGNLPYQPTTFLSDARKAASESADSGILQFVDYLDTINAGEVESRIIQMFD